MVKTNYTDFHQGANRVRALPGTLTADRNFTFPDFDVSWGTIGKDVLAANTQLAARTAIGAGTMSVQDALNVVVAGGVAELRAATSGALELRSAGAAYSLLPGLAYTQSSDIVGIPANVAGMTNGLLSPGVWTNAGGAEWIQASFTSAQVVGAIIGAAVGDYLPPGYGPFTTYLNQCRFQYWNSTAWVDLVNITGVAAGALKLFSWPVVTTTAIRIAGPQFVGTVEFQVVAAIPSPSLTSRIVSENLTANRTFTLPNFDVAWGATGAALVGAADAAAGRTVLGLGTMSTLSTITSADIADGTIVDGDISGSAAIAWTKISKSGAVASDVGAQTSNAKLTTIVGLTGATPIRSDGSNGALTAAEIPNLDAAKITTGTFADSQIPASIARDTEVAAAITAHAALTDPHPQYLTPAEGNAAYASLGAAGTTNLTVANRTATTLDILSDTGTDATVPAATTTLAGLISSADKVKLDGIAAGATANSTDAQLRDRSTHTGTQSVATITGLGSIATQNANAVVITGGTATLASGSITATTPTSSTTTGSFLLNGIGMGAGRITLNESIAFNDSVGTAQPSRSIYFEGGTPYYKTGAGASVSPIPISLAAPTGAAITVPYNAYSTNFASRSAAAFLTFSPAATRAAGTVTTYPIVADGINVPAVSFPIQKVAGTPSYDNRAGVTNTFQFTWDGTSLWYQILRAEIPPLSGLTTIAVNFFVTNGFLTQPGTTTYSSTSAVAFSGSGGSAQAIPAGKDGQITVLMGASQILGLHNNNTTPAVAGAAQNWLYYVWNGGGTLFTAEGGNVTASGVTGISGNRYVQIRRTGSTIAIYQKVLVGDPWALVRTMPTALSGQLFTMIGTTSGATIQIVSLEVSA